MRTKIIAKELIVELSYSEIRDSFFSFASCIKESIRSSFTETDYPKEIKKVLTQVDALSSFATKCTEKIMAAYSQGISTSQKVMKQTWSVDIGNITQILKQLSNVLPQENYKALLKTIKSSGIDKVLQINLMENNEK